MTRVQVYRAAQIGTAYSTPWAVRHDDGWEKHFRTHAAALADALDVVGLTPTNLEPMEAP